jgi:hypothetical protein
MRFDWQIPLQFIGKESSLMDEGPPTQKPGPPYRIILAASNPATSLDPFFFWDQA